MQEAREKTRLKTIALAPIEGKVSRFIENKALAVALLNREFGMIAGNSF